MGRPDEPGRPTGPAAVAPAAHPAPPATPPAPPAGAPGPATAPAPEPGDGPGRRPWARFRTVVRERLPLWWRLRCGVEPRTVAALALVLLAAVGFAVHHYATGRPDSVPVPEAGAPATAEALPHPGVHRPDASQGGSGARLLVDIAGDVREPGVHRLPAGARVGDALEAAGGVRPGTDPEALARLNRARRLVDGEQIVVGATPPPAAGPAGVPSAGAAEPGDRISLSSATAAELETLPGVGPVLARHIIDYRTAHGGFRSIGELRDVHGIGDARFAELRSRVGP
ncbi:ComEA family DNA-binding protein [Streptomyces sp. JJ36]|uniref:ComEA family DNA-binding protein n=1 Tax=Streptomyces sp. JJ36 TaxID=2736645 RepID=UPI001F32B3A5|nr:ComEA family DNA-binding protein [Streptomyces sp. JJ36]